MSTEELFNSITSIPKWYLGYMSATAASNMKKRFKQGTLSMRAIEKLATHFGYVKTLTWDKK